MGILFKQIIPALQQALVLS